LHVDDLAAACVFLLRDRNEAGWINIGTGEDISIKDLALMVKSVVDFKGELTFNTSKPDGTPRKLLDVSKINNLGWRHKIQLREGIERVYKDVLEKGFDAA